MTTTERHCYEVQCDRCGDAWEDSDYGTPHFAEATPELAEAAIIATFRWVRHPEHGLICDSCATTVLCEEQGAHLWPEWTPGADRAYRFCRRCNLLDQRGVVSVDLPRSGGLV